MKEVIIKNIDFDIRKFHRDCVSNLQTASGKQIRVTSEYNMFSKKFPITLRVQTEKNKEVKIHYTKYGEPKMKDLPQQTQEEFENYKLVIRKCFVEDGDIIKFTPDRYGVTGLAQIKKQSKYYFKCYYSTAYYDKFFKKFVRGEWSFYDNPFATNYGPLGTMDSHLFLWKGSNPDIISRPIERLANKHEKEYYLYALHRS